MIFLDPNRPVPEFIDPRFRENKPKTLVFSHRKRAFWAFFRKNCVYNFGRWSKYSGSIKHSVRQKVGQIVLTVQTLFDRIFTAEQNNFI
jgi:hypothetical protein